MTTASSARRVQLLTDEIASELGAIILTARAGRLCSVDYRDTADRMNTMLARRYGALDLVPASNPFGFSDALRAYLGGDLDAIDALPVETGGSAFQRVVWSALRQIPAGTTASYGEMAHRLGRPSAARAVGTANGDNPLSIVVPCHRLVGKDGSLTGYAGGLWRKRWLLEHERARSRSRRDGPTAIDAGALHGGTRSILISSNA